MIYFVQVGARGSIKIGFTANPKAARRISSLQTANPSRLRLLFCLYGCKKQEAALHERFDYARVRGEWFHPVPELLDHIDRMRGTKNPRKGSLLRAFLRRHNLKTCDGLLPTLRRLASFIGV